MSFPLARRITNMPLRRLITLFISVSTLLLLIALFFFYYSFYRTSLKTSYEYMDTALSQSSEGINALLDGVSASMLALAYSDDVYRQFVDVAPVERLDMVRVVRTMLNRLSASDPLIDRIALHLREGPTLFSDNPSGAVGSYMIFSAIIRDYALSEPFLDLRFTRCYTDLSTGQVYFACLVPVYNTTSGARSADRYAGAYVALCSARDLGYTKYADVSPARPIIMVAEDGFPVFTSDAALAPGLIRAITEHGNGDGPVRVDRTVYQLRMGKVDLTGWDILCVMPDAQLRSGLNAIRLWGLILTLSVLSVQILMGYTLRRSIVSPLSSIVSQIHTVGTDNGTVSLTVPDGSEIGILAMDIKDMLERIKRMNERMMDATNALYRAHTDRLEAQIMFLQAQINPHFLYNNLECIRGMTAAGQTDAIRRMVSLMAGVYRYCVSAGQVVSIREELDIARQFFSIIELRYGNRFSMGVYVDDEIADRPIPKMSLQPILENSFLHGLSGIESGGRVEIRGCTGPNGDTLLSVCDNGHGIDQQTLDALNRKLKNAGTARADLDGELRIGIQNVNSRIRLLFGQDYGVTLLPREPQGLCVTLSLGQTVTEQLIENPD
ncbi:MAG: sensor histidine kinase [Christensenellales bacterium]